MSDIALVPVFFTVNEDGDTYGEAHADLESALSVLADFPNDTITVRLATPACLRWLRDCEYDLDSALRDGMADSEYRLALLGDGYPVSWEVTPSGHVWRLCAQGFTTVQ